MFNYLWLILQNIENPLNLGQLQTAFRCYGIGIGMAIIAFISENMIKKLRKSVGVLYDASTYILNFLIIFSGIIAVIKKLRKSVGDQYDSSKSPRTNAWK